MTAGFQGWKNYYPPEDAPLIKRIRTAGGIILAKASLSEFTPALRSSGSGPTRAARCAHLLLTTPIGDNINSVLPGFARNPYNTAFGTGGSSGGTGAALAVAHRIVGCHAGA
jgi:Asp-tRNA(Asn)/Glu-tRNA(Gln) amidotransferase A subunit family amidase